MEKEKSTAKSKNTQYLLEVRVDVTTDEYIKHNNRAIARRPMMIMIYLLTAAIFVSLLWDCKLQGYMSWQYIVYLAFMVLLPTCLLPTVFAWKSRKTLEQDQILSGRPFYKFYEKGVNVSSGSVGKRFTWKEIYEVREDRAMFALMLDLTRALLLPKRCLSDEEIICLRQILKDQPDIKKKKLKK